MIARQGAAFWRTLALIVAVARTVSAQSIGDIGARVAPQFHSYTIGGPSSTKVSELSLPLFVLMPITRALTVDIGTAFARSDVELPSGDRTVTSRISGLTDTQLRGHYVLGNDFVVITGGINLPTGQSHVSQDQRPAASLIGSDFLALPISNMGTGLGVTGGVAVARPVGDWSVGGGVSLRRTTHYEPFDDDGGVALRYQPGNEYRMRIGVDRPIGTGRATVGFTYSTFGNDELAGSIYNTGDRYITQASFNNMVGRGELSVTGWNLRRTAGTMADSSYLSHENIANGALAYEMPVGRGSIEPNIEGRVWSQTGAPTSSLATIGVRGQLSVGGYSVSPSVGYSIGGVASVADDQTKTTARLTGFHAAVMVRVR